VTGNGVPTLKGEPSRPRSRRSQVRHICSNRLLHPLFQGQVGLPTRSSSPVTWAGGARVNLLK
jgi:hypothetical protein